MNSHEHSLTVAPAARRGRRRLGPTEAGYPALPQLEHKAAPDPRRERLHVVVLVAHLGPGRILASERETPNMLMNLV